MAEPTHGVVDNLDVHLGGGVVGAEGCSGASLMDAWESPPRYAATDPAR